MARIPSFGQPKKNQFSTLGGFDPMSANFDPAGEIGSSFPSGGLQTPERGLPGDTGDIGRDPAGEIGRTFIPAPSTIGKSFEEWKAENDKFQAAKRGGRGTSETPGSAQKSSQDIFKEAFGSPASFSEMQSSLGGGGASLGGGGFGGGGLSAGQSRAEEQRQDIRNRQLRQEYLEDLKQSRTLDLPGEAVGGVNRLVEEYNRAFGEAKGANEARYQQLLGISDETTGQRAADIRSRAFEERSDLEQGLARTGLANTTVSPTLTAGSRRREEESLNRLADQMQGTKLGIIERREDQYPDAASLQASLSGLGQGYGGTGVSALYSALGNVRQF